MRALVIDPHALFRMGLVRLLKQILGDFDLLEAADATEALPLLAGDPVDLALIDFEVWRQPSSERHELAVRLRGLPTVIISGRTDEQAMNEAIAGGASGFLLKASSPGLLRHAIGLALSGEDYIVCPRPASGRPPGEQSAARRAPQLSARQREIMALLGDGKSNKEIARRFGVSEGTVKVHLRTIYKKLQVTNRTQAAMVAVNLKLSGEDKRN